MNLYSKKTIKNLLEKHQASPLKSMGQNFLIDKGVAKKIIEAAELKPNENVLEIGPGIGTLTTELAKKTKRVIAMEKDPKMVEILKETLKDFNNIEIVQGDILKSQKSKVKSQNYNSKFKTKNYKIVANLPYYITSPVIRKFLESKNSPCQMILMVQKEVAQRICAKPPDMSILAISVQFYAEAKIISYVSKKSFWPIPKVNSAIIKIVPRQFHIPVSDQFCERFFKIVKAGFSQPRKQLVNNLTKELKINKVKIKEWLLKNEIQFTQRAESLEVKDWINLTLTFYV
jgi:16S rRNA (adenine1518-N6/adenine1519-N6)-dimethyltransferase